VQPGKIITYTIVVNNNGNANATSAVISDSLPANTQFVSNSIRLRPTGAGDEGSVPPLLASNVSITAGQKVTVTYAVRVDIPLEDGTTITNTASVTSVQTPELLTDSVVTLVTSSPDLEIDKFASPDPVAPGGILTYTIVVRNEGDANATGATISDSLPVNTNFIPGSLDLEPDGAGTLGFSPPTLVTDLVVTAGQQVTVTFAITVDTPLPDGTIITNTASVTSLQTATPKTDTITTTVSAVPDIQLVKTGPASATVSSTVVYTFTLTNEGNTPLQDIVLVDSLIGPVTNLLPGSDNGNDQLDLTETWIYTASYTIPITASSPLTNTAVVTATDGLFATVTDSDSHGIDIGYNPILRLTKTGPSAATFGSPVTFTFRVRHGTGSDGTPVDNVKIIDNYAGQAIFRGGDTNPANNKLDLQEIWTYQAKFTINSTIDSNPLINTGTVTAKDLGGGIVTAVATHSTQLSGFEPALFVDKDGPARADVGDTIGYTFDIINVNSLSVAKFKLEDRISAADMGDGSPITLTDIDDPEATGITYVGGDSNGNGKVDGGEKWVFAASHEVLPDGDDPLVNVVNVLGEDLEGHQVEATSSHSTNIVQNPVLRLVATGPVTGETGSEIELTLTVDHAMGSDDSPVTNITIKGGAGGDLTGLATHISGDDGNNILEGNEDWIYSFKYVIPLLAPDPLVIKIIAEGRDLDNDIITRTRNYTISTSSGPLLFFPLILKN
jgi:uncharacterized repeat protein (TIGR01451 family)